MEFTGQLKDVSRDWKTGQYNITFTVNEASAINGVNNIQDCEKLNIKAVKFRNKRSLDANAYLWVLCTKMGEVLQTSKDEVYEEMLQKYGVLFQDDSGNYITVTVKADIDMSKVGHWKFYKTNGKFSSYLLIKGTSEYDTAEMARFIDLVVQEAKDLDIETMAPEELERMKALWKA